MRAYFLAYDHSAVVIGKSKPETSILLPPHTQRSAALRSATVQQKYSVY